MNIYYPLVIINSTPRKFSNNYYHKIVSNGKILNTQ